MRQPPTIEAGTARGRRLFRGESAAQLVSQPRLAGPTSWVIAIMVALTVIAAAGGLALNNMALAARAELAGGATVQILEASAPERDRQARAVVTSLQDQPAITSVRHVPDAELAALLEPWLGVGANSEAVPVPALIDVRLEGAADERALNRLRGLLVDVAPAARVDAQSGWLAPVFSAIVSLQWLSAVLVLLLGSISAAVVWLAARSALGRNEDTIEIVHLLGGTDGQIARIFERSTGFDALIGGFVGMLVGLATVMILGTRFADLGAGMLGGGGLRGLDWALIALIPLAAVFIAILTVRLTVLATLRRLL